MKIKLFILMLLGLFSSVLHGAAWETFKEVRYNYAYSGKNHLVQLKPTNLNPDGCASKGWYVILSTSPNYDNLVKMALTAQASGKKFRPYLLGCSGGGKKGYPVILHAMMG